MRRADRRYGSPRCLPVLPPPPGAGANGSADPEPYFSPPAPVIIGVHGGGGSIEFQTAARGAHALSAGFRARSAGHRGTREPDDQICFRSGPSRRRFSETQVAFNLLSAYGEESKPSLADMRKGVARDVSRYLAGRAAVPAMQFVQAPVFYGYAFSAYAEFPSAIAPEQLAAAFSRLGCKGCRRRATRRRTTSALREKAKFNWRASSRIQASRRAYGSGALRIICGCAATNAVRIAEELVAASANA